ncbi:hypothetical protein [Hymenobacter jeollabukensis]|uniref:TonB C-terminal domain-containing protein n=1 Tax=Hymenobacter jeollabukensis TaxID=2025313 RepID=A0A5R8WWQ6_9BACT|nr:hypothetical protein [Hymenobacter jeollabukensis]TLM96594.1 hypothetical protein FDY95_00960 [Hymenobacter jeollabukensis]
MRFKLAFLLLVALPAHLVLAQQSGGVHTAPGKALRVQRGLPPPYVPDKAPQPPLPLVEVPRFWLPIDSIQRHEQRLLFWRSLQGKMQYPAPALRAQAEGKFTFRLVVGPDGVVQPAVLVRRSFTIAEPAYEPAALAAIEAEGQRVLARLRFASAPRADTVFVPLTFSLP